MRWTKRKLWTVGFAITVLVVAFLFYYIYSMKIEVELPEFTIQTLLIMLAFSFPASYTSTWIADWHMSQSTDLIDVFRETVVRVVMHWTFYLPLLLVYNYVVFGRIMNLPFLHTAGVVGFGIVGMSYNGFKLSKTIKRWLKKK